MKRVSRLPLLFGVFATLGVSVYACQGQDPVPKQRHSSRPPIDVPHERRPTSATVAQEPLFDYYAPARGYDQSRRSGWNTDTVPSWYSDRTSTGAYWPYEPTTGSGFAAYRGYRFRPMEPNEPGAPAITDPRGQPHAWGIPEEHRRGSPDFQVGKGGYGYAQVPGMRFRPLKPKQRDRPQSGSQPPYDLAPYQDPLYAAPFQDQDVYGFQPYTW